MSALLLEPHADDAVLFSCWNLLRYRPKVITVFRSDRMADARYPGGQVSHEQRVAESRAAFDLLGVEWKQWEFSDAAETYQVDREIRERLDALATDEVETIIHPAIEEDGHEQHNLIGMLAYNAFGWRRDHIHYLTYTRGGGRSKRGHDVPFEPDWPILKLRALACYESQIRHPATAPHFVEGLREWVA